jgi:predicted nucleic acid-binding protein
MAQVLVDTSAIYALVDHNDAFHRKAVATLRSMPRRGLAPLLTNFIVAESHALLLSRMGAALARRWLLGQTWQIEAVQARDEEVAKDIIRKYADKSFSYTDATSFAVMARTGISVAFGCDPHFQQYGFKLLT